MTVRFFQGDALTVLRTLPDASVHACITSPPYYALRSYLGADHADKPLELGSEPTPAAYIAAMVAVFREVRRVLHPTGLLLVNLGDGYVSSPPGNKTVGVSAKSGLNGVNGASGQYRETLAAGTALKRDTTGMGLPPKNLLMMPARVAIALQSDGWILRSQMPWVKRSCMPESCSDRPTSAIDLVYMFAKSSSTTFWVHRDLPGSRTQPAPDHRWVHVKSGEERSAAPLGWSDDEAIRKAWRRVNLWEGRDYFWDATAVQRVSAREPHAPCNKFITQPLAKGARDPAYDPDRVWGNSTRNFRNSDLFYQSLEPPHGLITDTDSLPVALDVNPAAFAEAHFATFPAKLVEPLVRAATSERGCCAACGAQWVRQTARRVIPLQVTNNARSCDQNNRGAMPRANIDTATTGWAPSCSCNADVVPCTVLDCFSGAGTTCLVSERLGRDSIGIELSREYIRLAERRLTGDAPLFVEVQHDASAQSPSCVPSDAMADLFSQAAD
jgi:hypothetical protein